MTIDVSDNLAFWNDSYKSGLNCLFSDTLNFNDNVSRIFFSSIIINDSINNWNDIASTAYIVLRAISDNIVLSDKISLNSTHFLNISDTNNIIDNLQVSQILEILKEDQLSQDDSINSGSSMNLFVNVSDTVNMQDSLGNVFKSTSFINYLRRYLNDVQ